MRLDGRVNLTDVDTSPGVSNVLAPPIGWTGSKQDYFNLLLSRHDTPYRQDFGVLIRRHLKRQDGEITGPYAEYAREFLVELDRRHEATQQPEFQLAG